MKPVHHANIPESFNAQVMSTKSDEATKQAANLDKVWLLGRLSGMESITVYPDQQDMPSWSAANSVWTKETLPLKNLVFSPVLPHAVTEWNTVYSGMCNYQRR